MQRRRALQVLGAFAALPALRGFSVGDLADLGEHAHRALDDNASASPRVLTPAQYRAVTMAAEHIIPRTDTPGATDARVADFIDVMLADWYPPADKERFIAGLAELDARATRECGRVFGDCAAADRLALLAALDTEVSSLRAGERDAAEQHWFATFKFLTVWGYYTSRAGIVDELKAEIMPGRYDGNAPYGLSATTNPPG
jgi:hypothetical protein